MNEQTITAEEFNAKFAEWTGIDFMALARQARKWADTDEVVNDGAECPKCGEARLDWLICQDNDTVKCATCGHIYELEEVTA